MKAKVLLLGTVLIYSMNASAGPIEMAHKAGFVGCDTAINTELSHYMKSSSGRINIEYDDVKMKNKAISFLVTYGSSGDTVLEKNTFINNGGSCHTYMFGQITTPKSCIQYKEENPTWEYIDAQGDYIWVKNHGGVISTLKNSPVGGCIVSFNRSSSGY
jgi:hypothetical protein